MQPLPIDPLLPEVVAALRRLPALVIEAPPGAGNHGLQYDCHDGNPVGELPPNAVGNTTYGAGGRCWAGATLQAFSIGMTYNF